MDRAMYDLQTMSFATLPTITDESITRFSSRISMSAGNRSNVDAATTMSLPPFAQSFSSLPPI